MVEDNGESVADYSVLLVSCRLTKIKFARFMRSWIGYYYIPSNKYNTDVLRRTTPSSRPTEGGKVYCHPCIIIHVPLPAIKSHPVESAHVRIFIFRIILSYYRQQQLPADVVIMHRIRMPEKKHSSYMPYRPKNTRWIWIGNKKKEKDGDLGPRLASKDSDLNNDLGTESA